ncbi:brevican core protein-like [Haliotis asinina]|uniref:brevican core protein-like n=1 Tax=Haliotis asinina TaxID=109174 RepID=UPI003531B165
MPQSLALVLFFSILRPCVVADGAVQYTVMTSATPIGSSVQKEILITTVASRLQCTVICAGLLSCRTTLYNAMDNRCQIFDTLQVPPPNNMEHTRFYVRDWCPEGFSLLSEVEGPCIKFHLDKVTWLEAKNNCNLYSPTARLVVADNAQKFQKIKNAGLSMNSQFQDAIWIGLSDMSSTLRDFKWVNEQPLGSFTYWSNSDFSTSGQNACVVLLRAGYWKWTPTSCTGNKHYVCEVPASE